MPSTINLQEPTFETPRRIKESLRKMYKQAMVSGEEELPYGRDELSGIELAGAVVGRIISLPFRAIKETGDMAGDVMRGAQLLRRPMGEGGGYTAEQVKVASEASMLALAGVGGGMPGGGTGVANIGRKEALKGLAKEFRALTKPRKKFIQSLKPGPGVQPLSEGILQIGGKEVGILQAQGKTYRGITKGVHNIPQEKLDLIESIGLLPEGKPGVGGRYLPMEKRVEISPKSSAPIEAVGHEFEHAARIADIETRKTIASAFTKKDISLSREQARALTEGTAYEFGAIFEQKVAKLPKGQRITTKMFEDMYKEAGVAAREKWGLDWTKWKKEDIVKAAKLRSKWEKFDTGEAF